MSLPMPILWGLAASTVGGWLGSLFQRKAQASAVDDYRKMLGEVLTQIPRSTLLSLYSAAGTVGPQVRPAFEIAKAGLGPSAEAVGAAGAMRQAGLQGIAAVERAAEAAERTARQQMGEVARQAIAAAYRTGMTSPSALSSLASSVGRATGEATSQALQASTQPYLQALQQAANLDAAAARMLEESRAERFRTDVAPYMAQGVWGGLLGQVPRLESLFGMQAAVNPWAGLAAALGNIGTQLIGVQLAPMQARAMEPFLDILRLLQRG